MYPIDIFLTLCTTHYMIVCKQIPFYCDLFSVLFLFRSLFVSFRLWFSFVVHTLFFVAIYFRHKTQFNIFQSKYEKEKFYFANRFAAECVNLVHSISDSVVYLARYGHCGTLNSSKTTHRPPKKKYIRQKERIIIFYNFFSFKK